jgi:hypothetical protein
MKLHLREKNFMSRNNDRAIAWCDEGILIIDGDNINMDLLIDNRKVYVGTADATEDNGLVFSCCQVMEE